jgi:hypothetical protein
MPEHTTILFLQADNVGAPRTAQRAAFRQSETGNLLLTNFASGFDNFLFAFSRSRLS